MNTLAAIYADDIHKQFNTLYAVWPPNEPLKLGDIGLLNDHVFIRTGTLKDSYNIEMGQTREFPNQKATYEYASSGSTSLEFHNAETATPGGVPVKANVTISFSDKHAVYFNAVDCVPSSIGDQDSLGKTIMTRFAEGDWDPRHAVITGLMNAGATTLVISGAHSSSIVLEASTDGVKRIELSDASIKLSISRETNVAYRVVTEQGFTPLLGLSQIQHKILRGDHWGPRYGLTAVRAQAMDSLNQLGPKERKAVADSVYFGMLH